MRQMVGCALFACVLAAGPVFGQYFGQNKVRYETFDFKVLDTKTFHIYFYPRERTGATDAGRMAERWDARYSKLLNWKLSSHQPLILYDNPIAFQSTTVIPGFISEATGGVTEPLRRRIVMPLAGPLRETNHVLGHELVHAFQFDLGKRAVGGAGRPGVLSLPTWFIEGMAEYLSLGPSDPLTAMWMRDAVRREEVPTIRQLRNSNKYFPYRYGQAVWAYIGGRYGDDKIGPLLRAANSTGGVNSALSKVLHISSAQLSKHWRRALQDQYEPVLKATRRVEDVADTVIPAKKEQGFLNVGPVVSPDGRRMMIYSQRSLFAVDLYLADASTGKFIRRITRTAINPHINSIEFINSAGGWSRDGKLFVYPEFANGHPRLALYDFQADHVTRRISLPQFAEVQSPVFSPDGRQVAFTALSGGLTDLCLVDVATGQVRRLTEDQYAELQPAWSPDGARIAFVTDRFTSNLGDLNMGHYRIGLMNIATGDIHEAPGWDTGNAIDPQWSPDGRSLYFISDRDGIPNIYRVALDSARRYQLTNVQTGVSGITALSPALSVASSSGRIVFSAFSSGDFGIYALEKPAAVAGAEPETAVARLNAAVLPPRSRAEGVVASDLAQPVAGLVSSAGFQVKPYHPSLSLDYIAPPSVGVGMSNFGTIVGGGTALYFSDLLGYHELMASIQSATFSEETKLTNSLAGVAVYQNMRHRWTWGAMGGQVPYVSGGYSQGLANVQGQTVFLDQQILFWQIDRQVAGLASYPFNRAQRVEFSAGFQNIGFDAVAINRAYDPNTGAFLGQQKQNLPTFPGINVGTGSAALVYDTSVFGGTSPIMGQRYRLEGDVAGGNLNWTTALADYRRYFRLARPLTFAIRVLHYGRYGGGANDQRLQDLYIGYPSLVRGYDPNSFSPSECGAALSRNGTCPVFERLLGSRIAVGNAEFRIPLLGFLGVIPTRKLPPVELAPFFDIGIAWNRPQADVPNHAVRSTGGSLRANLLGFAVAQISYVHPLDRPARSWLWEFSLIPGF